MTLTRPVLRYYGGKFRLAPWITSHMPAHQVYTEAFCGAASVLLQKPRCYSEVINDLDSDIVNLFQVLRDPEQACLLEQVLRLTPFAREELQNAYEHSSDPVERARRLLVRSFMGYGSTAANIQYQTGFRSNIKSGRRSPARDWAGWPDAMPAIISRLQGVTVEHRPAVEVLIGHDSTETLHYVDPPYVSSTRCIRKNLSYAVEMTDEDHIHLSDVLHELEGMVLLSGYNCPLYADLYSGWRSFERDTYADGAAPRTEVLWINSAAARALERGRSQMRLEVLQ